MRARVRRLASARATPPVWRLVMLSHSSDQPPSRTSVSSSISAASASDANLFCVASCQPWAGTLAATGSRGICQFVTSASSAARSRAFPDLSYSLPWGQLAGAGRRPSSGGAGTISSKISSIGRRGPVRARAGGLVCATVAPPLPELAPPPPRGLYHRGGLPVRPPPAPSLAPLCAFV